MNKKNRPAAAQLHLEVPSPQEALFQHQPSPNAKVRIEWEPGCQPDAVYDAALPPWRAWIRRYLVKRLRLEKEWMAGWQQRIRTEGRDRFFYWTAIFGTHTFFMTFLPLPFWFGHQMKGRALVNVVGLGIYVSSFSKDLVCAPRPYSPPVVRLSMSTHAHEFGFPSSHSTNSVTIALFAAQWVWELRQQLDAWIMVVAYLFLTVYAVSVVGGRLYTGMHSIADIVGGSIMGAACWLIGIYVEPIMEAWALTGASSLPLVTIPVTLACVHFHPDPVDPCPCFEDAIAVLAVMLGTTLAQWWEAHTGIGVAPVLFKSITSSGPIFAAGIAVERTVIGIAMIVIWRLIAKATLLRVLPTVFRVSSRLFDFDLPTRRGYTAATDYSGVPTTPIRPIPSFLDLHNAAADSTDVSPEPSPSDSGSGVSAGSSRSLSPLLMPDAGLRRRTSGKSGQSNGRAAPVQNGAGPGKRKRRRIMQEIKFDAEVLTKVGVYFGIGFLAAHIAPRVFGVIEDLAFA